MRHHSTTLGDSTTTYEVRIDYRRWAGERDTDTGPQVLIEGVTLRSMTIATPKGSDVVVRRDGFTADALLHIEAGLHLIVEADDALIEELEQAEPPRYEDDGAGQREERAA